MKTGRRLLTTSIIVVVVLMMCIFSFFSGSEESGPDEAVLALLRKNGSDFSKPHHFDFYLYFPSLSAAEEAARSMQDDGFEVEISKDLEDDSWLCLGKKTMVPELAVLERIRREFRSLATSLKGDYDGLETAVEE